MKPVEFHPQSEAEFKRDVDFYQQRSAGLASEFVAAVEQAVIFIAGACSPPLNLGR